MIGRPNTPTELKRLQGTARSDRVLPDQMAPEPLQTLPSPPEQLEGNALAKQVWYETTAALEALKMLTVVDMRLLATYCAEVSRYWKAQEQLALEGEVITSHNGYPMPNPWMGIGNQALDRALKIAGQYGFTPSARTRIGMGQVKERDEFEEAMGL
ncbi:phage terminase small subunit P27 family [Spirosoma sp. HMF4905]|uniref:Phage terminase small subunit P27 family n=1 Tax=Spirosoma arboris TaxID=2682092 RepID=A0A7K1SBM9_9BACT|nr:phage terminase small subunit P27 family [Spirosoma arboris]MVM31181.1 phage terminase small subunit P27 family [Spirosoma arboris]